MRRISLPILGLALVGVQFITYRDFAARDTQVPTGAATTVPTSAPFAFTATTTLSPKQFTQAAPIPPRSLGRAITAHGLAIELAATNTLRIDEAAVAIEAAVRITNVSQVPIILPKLVVTCGDNASKMVADGFISRAALGEPESNASAIVAPGASEQRWLEPVLLLTPLPSGCDQIVHLSVQSFAKDGVDRGEGFVSASGQKFATLPADALALIADARPFPPITGQNALCDRFVTSGAMGLVNAREVVRKPTCLMRANGRLIATVATLVDDRLIATTLRDIAVGGREIQGASRAFAVNERAVWTREQGALIVITLASGAVPYESERTLEAVGRALGW